MPLATTGQLVRRAQDDGRGIAAFNVITLEHAEGIVRGAGLAGVPVILQISENAVKFHGGRLAPIAAAACAVADSAAVDVSAHLDHVEDVELLHRAAVDGLSSAMFDASRLDYDDNVAATRAAADWAHVNAIFLEAELGTVGGKDGAHAPGVRTDPEEARAGMVKVNIGTILNLAFTGAVRATVGQGEHVVDPRKYLAPSRAALADVAARLAAVVGGAEA